MSKRGGESWGTGEAVDEINATVTIQSGGSCAGQSAPEVEMARRWLAGVADLLEQKNAAYGNSALAPMRVFSRADRREGLRVRIDDKLSRMARGDGCATEDTLRDLVGYLALLAVTAAPEPVPEPNPVPEPEPKTHVLGDGETDECPLCHGNPIARAWNARDQTFYGRVCGGCGGRGRVPKSGSTYWTRAKSIAAWDAMCKRHAAEAAGEVEPRASADERVEAAKAVWRTAKAAEQRAEAAIWAAEKAATEEKNGGAR